MLLLLRQEENRLRGGGVRPQSTALELSFDNLNDLRIVQQTLTLKSGRVNFGVLKGALFGVLPLLFKQ